MHCIEECPVPHVFSILGLQNKSMSEVALSVIIPIAHEASGVLEHAIAALTMSFIHDAIHDKTTRTL
jgi:hypothetical protein